MQVFRFLFYYSIAIGLSSCTFSRLLVHNIPSTLDHEKAFVCDTIVAASEAYLSASVDPAVRDIPLLVQASSPQNIPSIKDWVPEAHSMEAYDLEDLLDLTETTAFIVIRNDSILYEKYMRGGTAHSPRVGFSISKSITAMLVAIAQEEGYLNIQQEVADFIPEFGEDDRKDIKLVHLLNMVSGIGWREHGNALRLGLFYYARNQEKYIKKHSQLKYPVGTHYDYKSISTMILGICLERATNMRFKDYFEQKLWHPLGMEEEAYMTLDSKRQRQSRFYGGLALSPRAMARFGQLLLNQGCWEGKQLLPRWFVDGAATRDTAMYSWGYKYCFKHRGYDDVNFLKNQHFYAEGYLGQLIFVSPQDNMIIVRQGNADENAWDYIMGRLASLLGRGYNDLTNPELDFSDQLAGTYEHENGLRFELQANSKPDKFARQTWRWLRDKKAFPDFKKVKNIYQVDGISAQYKEAGHYARFYMDVQDGKVKGLYLYDSPDVETRYFLKI